MNKTTTTNGSQTPRHGRINEAAHDVVEDSKHLANEIYEEGRYYVNEAHSHAREYSDEMLEKVRKNPASALMIAAGVGFLLSSILRK